MPVSPGAFAHPVDARGTGVLLDAFQRLSEILAGQRPAPTSSPRRGEERCRRAPGMDCCSERASSGFTLRPSRPGPIRGWLPSTSIPRARASCISASRSALPSDHRSPLVLRPLLTSPRRATASRPPPSRTTPRTRNGRGILGHPWRPPRVRPATFIAHPPRLRNGPLMTSGFASWEQTRPDRPALYAQPTNPVRDPARHVFLESRFRTPASSPPSLTTSSCHRLVVGAITSTGDLHPRAAGHASHTPSVHC